MCGIVGYVGKDKALPILLDGLQSLEYRGYDSAGVVVFEKHEPLYVRSVGKVVLLNEKVQSAESSGTTGISHTRWATHGGVTEKNAHPHTGCGKNIFLVHNGIIENYKELKDALVTKGHAFSSETDTEVLAHLIEEEKKGKDTTLEEAIRKSLAKVQGTYGLVVGDAREPGKLVAARNFSPLLLGVGDGEYLIASDANAVLKRTNKVVYLENGDIAVVTAGSHKIFSGGTVIDRSTAKLEGADIVLAKKGGYEHFMLKEICEQPEAIKNSIRGRLAIERGEAVLGGLRDVEEKLRHAKRIIISACGSAYLAGKIGEYVLEEYAGIPTEVEYASEFRYRKPIFQDGDVFLAISQSGETADTLASLAEAKGKGVLTLGLVNAVGSTVARETDAGVYNHIGPEIGVAATKSFVSQVSILTLLALYMGRMRRMSLVTGKRIGEELIKIPAHVESILARKNELQVLAQKYGGSNNFFFLGRKYNFPVAHEGALKLKEISYVHAEGYSAGELKHGPIALINAQFPTIAIAPQDSVYAKMISNIEEIKARGGPVLAIATEGDESIKGVAGDVFYIPKTLEALTPILAVIPLQLFGYYFGVQKGLDVDKPRNLAKSVTVE